MQNKFISAVFVAVSAITTLATAAPAKENAASVIKRDDEYSGTATWYSPEENGGPQGACWGEYIDDESRTVALNADQYGDIDDISDWCGTEVEIDGPEGTVQATIIDVCPECEWGDLDLTPDLFREIAGDLDLGVADITWRVL